MSPVLPLAVVLVVLIGPRRLGASRAAIAAWREFLVVVGGAIAALGDRPCAGDHRMAGSCRRRRHRCGRGDRVPGRRRGPDRRGVRAPPPSQLARHRRVGDGSGPRRPRRGGAALLGAAGARRPDVGGRHRGAVRELGDVARATRRCAAGRSFPRSLSTCCSTSSRSSSSPVRSARRPARGRDGRTRRPRARAPPGRSSPRAPSPRPRRHRPPRRSRRP